MGLTAAIAGTAIAIGFTLIMAHVISDAKRIHRIRRTRYEKAYHRKHFLEVNK